MAYCGYVVKIQHLRPHSNADRLQIATVFGNDVVVDLNVQMDQLMIYFPTDGQLGEEFCKVNDLVRRKDENGNNAGGYLDPEKRNVKAIKLRGEKSDGILLPVTCLAQFTKISDLQEGDQITALNGVEICRKYIPQSKRGENWHNGAKERKPRQKIAPTFYEHVDTAQLAYNLSAFKAGDIVELTLKMHGTSGRTGHLPLRHYKQSWLDKLLKKPGKPYMEYGYITGTRRTVLSDTTTGGYYGDEDFRRQCASKFEGKLHKGEVVYYEIVGFVNAHTPIMASVKNSKIKDPEFIKQYGEETVFSYGCVPTPVKVMSVPDDWDGSPIGVTVAQNAPQFEAYVYRMTMVNDDGDVVEYSPDQMRVRCEQMGVKYVPVFERFIIPAEEEVWIDEYAEMPNGEPYTVKQKHINYVDPGEYVVRKVEQYFDGPDPIGKTHIREGVVARIVNRPSIAVYKHKNHTFKMLSGIAVEQVADGETAVDESVLEEL